MDNPFMLQTLPIKDVLPSVKRDHFNFLDLRPRMINLLFNALQVESDPTNAQLLLGALMHVVQDSATFEGQRRLHSGDHHDLTDAEHHGAAGDRTLVNGDANHSENGDESEGKKHHVSNMRASVLFWISLFF